MSKFGFKSFASVLAGALLLGQSLCAQAQLPEFTELVEATSPAVVNISTRQKLPERALVQGMPDLEGLPPLFREFLERNIPQVPRTPNNGQQREAHSLGSGFIISADGYVLTNNHVVADADEIIVRLSDRSELEAELVGADPLTDVALLKVKGTNLPSVKLGRTDELKGRVGSGHRFALRIRPFSDGRHHQRHRAELAERELRAVHSNRCGDQSRQLRRTAL